MTSSNDRMSNRAMMSSSLRMARDDAGIGSSREEVEEVVEGCPVSWLLRNWSESDEAREDDRMASRSFSAESLSVRASRTASESSRSFSLSRADDSDVSFSSCEARSLLRASKLLDETFCILRSALRASRSRVDLSLRLLKSASACVRWRSDSTLACAS